MRPTNRSERANHPRPGEGNASQTRRRSGSSGSHGATVLVVDEDHHADRYAMWLSKTYTVRTASTRDETLAVLDASVAVVLLGYGLDGDLKRDVVAAVEETSSACKIALVSTEREAITDAAVAHHGTITRPVTEDAVSTTVARLLRRAVYHDALRTYYGVTARMSAYEISDGETDRRSDPDYERLRRRRSEAIDRIEELQAALSADDKRAVLDALTAEATLPARPDDSSVKTRKHRPDSCRECGLEWGIDHGGDVGDGYLPLGAYTWKCRRCGSVQSVPNPNNRSLARRRY